MKCLFASLVVLAAVGCGSSAPENACKESYSSTEYCGKMLSALQAKCPEQYTDPAPTCAELAAPCSTSERLCKASADACLASIQAAPNCLEVVTLSCEYECLSE
jgi:hypothetical protein